MYRAKLTFLLSFIIYSYSFSQIKNSDFEIWELIFSDEVPKYWFCDGSSFDACARVMVDINDSAVRMDNSLPCVDPVTGEGISLGNGRLSQEFIAPGKEFTLSYDLVIDSLDAPATFNVRLRQVGVKTLLHMEHTEIFDGTISHHIVLENETDLEMFIQFEPEGNLKPNAAHDCDRGYISALFDNVRVETIVNTNQVEKFNTKIYPNPSSGLIYIEQSDANIAQVQVYDFLGSLVTTLSGENKTSMELNLNASAQFYLLKITYTNGDIGTKRIFVE